MLSTKIILCEIQWENCIAFCRGGPNFQVCLEKYIITANTHYSYYNLSQQTGWIMQFYTLMELSLQHACFTIHWKSLAWHADPRLVATLNIWQEMTARVKSNTLTQSSSYLSKPRNVSLKCILPDTPKPENTHKTEAHTLRGREAHTSRAQLSVWRMAGERWVRSLKGLIRQQQLPPCWLSGSFMQTKHTFPYAHLFINAQKNTIYTQDTSPLSQGEVLLL